MWRPEETVDAVAYDTPIPGGAGALCCGWSARSRSTSSRTSISDHAEALADRVRLEAISRVLYEDDDTAPPREEDLRLRQEYFFASASLQDLLRRHRSQHGELTSLPDHVAIS